MNKILSKLLLERDRCDLNDLLILYVYTNRNREHVTRIKLKNTPEVSENDSVVKTSDYFSIKGDEKMLYAII